MRLIVVGAGGATRDLLRGLGEIWDVTVVDTDPDRLAEAEKLREIETVLGDGSSRVVLGRAHLDEAAALVAASSDDEMNLEACRLALDAGLFRVAAVAADPERLVDYRDLQVVAFSPDRLAARRIEGNLEPRRVTSAAFAEGKAEAIEFRVVADSPVRGKALRDLHSVHWLVAAIMRDGRFIVPHGGSVLQDGDLVTVVGAAADYSRIVHAFTPGQARFPIEFGKHVAVVLESEADLEGPVTEAVNLTRNSAAEALLVVHRAFEDIRDETRVAELERLLEQTEQISEGVQVRTRPVTGSPPRSLVGVAGEESIGVLAVPAPTGRGFLARSRLARTLRSLRPAGVPLLLSRGMRAYSRIVVPTRGALGRWAAVSAAIDLASYSKATLVGVAAIPPALVAGSEARDEAVETLGRLREEATVLGVSVQRRLRRTNVARALEATLHAGFLVLGMPSRAALRPPVFPGQLLLRVSSSVLLVPVPE